MRSVLVFVVLVLVGCGPSRVKGLDLNLDEFNKYLGNEYEKVVEKLGEPNHKMTYGELKKKLPSDEYKTKFSGRKETNINSSSYLLKGDKFLVRSLEFTFKDNIVTDVEID